MADLTELQSASPVKLVTTDNVGSEQAFILANYGASSEALRVVHGLEKPSFTFNAYNIGIANNKSMLAVMNSSVSNVLRLVRVKIVNSQTSAVTGVVADFRLRRLTALSGGTAITAFAHDTADSLGASITSATGGTATDLAGPVDLMRWQWSSDEWGPGSPDVESTEHYAQNLIAAYQPSADEKPLSIRSGQGIDLRQITNSTNGTFDISMTFLQE